MPISYSHYFYLISPSFLCTFSLPYSFRSGNHGFYKLGFLLMFSVFHPIWAYSGAHPVFLFKGHAGETAESLS
jgi:hypothetical protein